jgi:hypothetical protein
VQPTGFAMPAQNLIKVGVGGSNPFACSRFPVKTHIKRWWRLRSLSVLVSIGDPNPGDLFVSYHAVHL